MITIRLTLLALLLAGSAAAQVVPGGGGTGGGITQVAATPTTCTAGAQFYNTTLQQFIYCPATNTPVTTSGMIIQAVSAKVFLDGTVTNGSATVTSAGQANFLCPNASYPCSTVGPGSDVGLKIFATNVCNGSQCDYINDQSSTTILPSTQTKVGRIATVNSATSVTVDCAAPGNCASPNASATNTGHATVLYGPDSTTALNTAYNTAQITPGCPAIIIPQGIYFFNLPIFASTPVSTGVCINPTLVFSMPQAVHYSGLGGLIITGYGADASILTPTPDFTNPGASPACIGVSTGTTQSWMNFTVGGFGQSLNGAGFVPCSTLAYGASSINYVSFHGWGSAAGGSLGLSVQGGFNHLTNVEVYGFGGGVACYIGTQGVEFVNVICGQSQGNSGQGALRVTSGSTFQSTNSIFIVGNGNNNPQIEVQSGGIWQSSNDTVVSQPGNSAPSDDIKIDSGGIAYITNMLNSSGSANSKGIETVGTGQIWLTNYHHTGTPNKSVTNAGTLFDGGNNSFAGSITNTGSWLNESASANATVVTAAKLVLSGTWGASATVTALSGGNAPIQFTITNTGAGQGASPTITYTFPTPYPVAPFRCTATQTGGTNASLAPYTASSLTATGVIFTATGTPTAASTEIMLVTCDTP